MLCDKTNLFIKVVFIIDFAKIIALLLTTYSTNLFNIKLELIFAYCFLYI